MSRSMLLPALACAVAVAAASALIVLQQRSGDHYKKQIALTRVENDLNALQNFPWNVENPRVGTPAALHGAMVGSERKIVRTLRSLGPVNLDETLAAARRNFGSLERIYRMGLQPNGWNTPAIGGVSTAETVSLRDATGQLEVAAAAEKAGARAADRESAAGVVVAMLLLCAGFLYYHRRSFTLSRSRLSSLERLEAAEVERRRLLARTVEVAEHERIRLAIELHDGPIQRLTALAFNLDMLARRIERGKLDGLDVPIGAVRESLAGEMTSLRRLMVELRPPVLDERGILAALEDAAAGELEGSNTHWVVRGGVGELQLAPELETCIYRVVREALVNARKHADASFVDVLLFVADGDTIGITIQDDGRGFDAEACTQGADGTRFGIVGMEERVAGLAGAFELRSTPGHGTRIDVRLPVKEAKGVQEYDRVAA